MYIFICITITHLRLSHHLDGNTIRCSCAKDKAKISSGRNEGSFVGTLGLVLQLTINRFGHDRVAEGQEAENTWECSSSERTASSNVRSYQRKSLS